MNYNLNFDVQNNLFILYIICFLAAAFFAVIYYRKSFPEISKKLRSFLSIIRILVLLIVVFMIIDMIVSVQWSENLKPKTAVMLDNSLSMKFKADDERLRKDLYTDILENFDFDYDLYLFSKDIKKSSLSEADYDGQLTNISSNLERLLDLGSKENIRNIILLSDGNYNIGVNPLEILDLRKIPKIFTFKTDTNVKKIKDLSLRNLVYDKKNYVNNDIKILVNVLNTGFDKINSIVKIYNDEKVLQEKMIKIDKSSPVSEAEFTLKFSEPGIYKLRAEIEPNIEESNKENNWLNFQLNVRESKRKILFINGYPNLDYTYIKNALIDEDDFEIEKITFYNGTSIMPLSSDLNKIDIDKYDLFILNKLDLRQVRFLENNFINKLFNSKKPFAAAADENFPFTYFKQNLKNEFPFNDIGYLDGDTYSRFSDNTFHTVMVVYENSFQNFQYWNSLAPVTGYYRVQIENNEFGKNLLLSKNSKENDTPLISIFEKERSIVYFWGNDIWHWSLRQAKYKDSARLFNDFIKGMVKYLTDPDKYKHIFINDDKREFYRGEDIEIILQLFDSNFNPENDASITAFMQDEKGYKYPIEFEKDNVRSNWYRGLFVPEEEGVFQFSAVYYDEDTLIDSLKAEYVVWNKSKEYSDKGINENLLKGLAEASGGRYVSSDSLAAVKNFLDKKVIAEDFSKNFEIIKHRFPFFIIVGLLSLEWIIRRKKGLP